MQTYPEWLVPAIPQPAQLRGDYQLLKITPEEPIVLTIDPLSNKPVNNQNTMMMDAFSEIFADNDYLNWRAVMCDPSTRAFKRGWGRDR